MVEHHVGTDGLGHIVDPDIMHTQVLGLVFKNNIPQSLVHNHRTASDELIHQ